MSKDTMLEHVVLLTSESSAVAGIYLDHAIQAILNRLYPWHDAEDDIDYSGFPRKYETLAEEIAVYLINKRGAEGETAHNENGINRTYESASVPDSMLRTVIPMVKIPGGNLYEGTGAE